MHRTVVFILLLTLAPNLGCQKKCYVHGYASVDNKIPLADNLSCNEGGAVPIDPNTGTFFCSVDRSSSAVKLHHTNDSKSQDHYCPPCAGSHERCDAAFVTSTGP